MAQLIRSKDWSETALGPIEHWPQSLRTTVSLVQASSSPISLAWGRDHVQIYNDGYWPICGAKHPRAMGQDFRACWASAFPVIGELYEAAWAGRSGYLENMRMFLDRHGFLEETWFTFSFSPITDESGGVGGVFHPVTEVTAQLLSERRTKTLRELASRTARARTTTEAYTLAMRTLGEAERDLPFVLLYLIDDDQASAALIGQCGLPVDTAARPAAVGRGDDDPWHLAEVMVSGASRVVAVGHLLAGLRVGPYPEVPSTAMVLPVLRPGSERPAAVLVLGLSARLPVDDGCLTFAELVGAAVSAAVGNAQAHEEAEAKAAALAELDRGKTSFFSNVSHELRTPLTLILAPIEDARRRGAALFGERLELVHRSGLRLLRLVNDLLDFSRIEAGRLESTFAPIDLALVTAGLAEAFRSLVEPAGLTLTIDCPPLPAPVYVDREHWEKIVTNLIGNAFKFTLAGGIAIRLRAVGDHAELRIADTGTGIPAAELPRVFERFHRVEGSRGRTLEGTGIGLSLVHELVRAHRGAIDVASEVGVGTTFTVKLRFGAEHLPVDRVRSAPARPEPTPIRPVAADSVRTRRIVAPTRPLQAVRGSRPRILVADDHDDMRDYLASVLAPLWEVEGVADGRLALARALADPPELLISDVMMPGLDGFGLVRALRADPRTGPMPIILLSARAGEESVIDGLEVGANDYLVKPFSSRELVSRVRTQLETARLRRELLAGARELDAIVENLPHMVFVKDAERLAFIRLNRAGEQLLGLDRNTLLGKTDHDFFPPEQAAFFVRTDRETLSGLAPVDIVEEPIATPRGRRWLHTKKVPIPDEAGRPRYLLGISEDITEQRRAQAELIQAKEAAELANRELESFSYSVAHDLRAPLRGIAGFAQALTEDHGARLDDEGRRYLRFVRESAQRMGVLIDDLLDLSRVTRTELVRQPCDLTALAAAALAKLARSHPERAVEQVLAPGLIAEGDPHLLAVALDNLLGNAWKFTRRRADARIEVGSLRGPGGLAFFVRDNGAGFDEAYADRLFGVFQRLHSQAEFEGTGVGLATVQRIIRRHGGKLWAQGKVGDGATFYFSLKVGGAHE